MYEVVLFFKPVATKCVVNVSGSYIDYIMHFRRLRLTQNLPVCNIGSMGVYVSGNCLCHYDDCFYKTVSIKFK